MNIKFIVSENWIIMEAGKLTVAIAGRSASFFDFLFWGGNCILLSIPEPFLGICSIGRLGGNFRESDEWGEECFWSTSDDEKFTSAQKIRTIWTIWKNCVSVTEKKTKIRKT